MKKPTIRSLDEFMNKRCEDCDLCKSTDQVCLMGYGKVPADIMLVGEAPGPRIDGTGVPFVGKAGRILTGILDELGLSRDQIYITNVVHCRPPENRTPEMEEIRACRKYLLQEIHAIKPRVIITLGNVALKGLFDTNLMSVSKERGRLLSFEKIKVIPTYHPAAALRKTDFAKWIYQDIKEGLKRAANTAKTSLSLDYRIITQANKKEALKAILSQKEVVVDVETTSLEMFDPKEEILIVGFCSKEGQSWIYPKTTPGMLEFTQQVLDGAETIIGHNIKFDLKWLYTRGLTYKKPIWDTMVALHLLDENYPDKSLKHLAKTDLGEMGQELDQAEQVILKHRKDGTEPSEEEWRKYNGGDVDATFRLYKKFKAALEKESLSALMMNEMKVLKVLTYMEMEGFQVDRKRFKELKTRYEKLITEKEVEIKQQFGDINLRSTPQLVKALYTDRGLPILVVTEKGTPSCNEAALQAILKTRLKSDDKEAITNLLAFRSYEKLYSVYLKGLEENGLIKGDSRIHCNYKITGTVTGRLSCSDPNLQNIPREGDIKYMFTSRFPGGSIIQGDYGQAELRLLAHHSGAGSLIKAFESGRDIHREVGAKVFKKAYDQVTEQERKFTKQVNFGIVYLISAEGLADKLNISAKQAGKLIREWFAEFPEVERWIKKQKLQVAVHGVTENIFGRKRRFFAVNPETGEGREAQRQGVNAPIQGGAGDLTKWAMMKTHYQLKREGLKAIVIGNVHDAIMIDSPREEVTRAAEILRNHALHPPMKLKVPLGMDFKAGPSWGELKELKLKEDHNG